MSDHEVDVLIVGAGLSGIAAAYHLQKRSPEQTYTILESRDAIGGTWALFRYPGIRSDSDMYTFGFAFKPWTDGKVFADGDDIRNYVQETAEENGIDQHIRFQRRVVSANWNSQEARWSVVVEHAGEREKYTCRFLMMCSGYYRYDQGHMPHFQGQEDFKGEIIHPQQWQQDQEYAGKRIVIIGSGATAVTLVPAMAQKAASVTMVQRSPTYIASRPSRDKFANFLRKILPGKMAYGITRSLNILLTILVFQLAQAWPNFVKKGILKQTRAALGPDFDVEKHFSPRYNPWSQRFCLAPDGDFFKALRDGSASIRTDQIERFTADGLLLESGETLDADIIIPATGLEMLLLGGVVLCVDGKVQRGSDLFTYRGMMLSGIPNLAIAFGYTNASWTLKVDLTFERVCRTLNHMKKHDLDICTPIPPADIEPRPMLEFSSGYVQRALSTLPQQGSKPPWRTYQNYIQDMMAIRFGKLDDGHLKFSRRSEAALQSTEPASEAAE